MKKLFALVVDGSSPALALAGVAQAGCMATVGLSSTPKAGLAAGTPWVVTIRVLQHGRTPMPDAKPEVRIRKLRRQADRLQGRSRPRASGRTAPASSSRSPAATRSASTTASPSRSARWSTPSTRRRLGRRRAKVRVRGGPGPRSRASGVRTAVVPLRVRPVATLASVSEKHVKPGAAGRSRGAGATRTPPGARRARVVAARAAAAHEPAEVFVALRDDDEHRRRRPLRADPRDRDRSPGWPASSSRLPGATLLDDESLDWLVLAVVTFIGGLFYGVAGYFLLGLASGSAPAGSGVDAGLAGRRARSWASPPSRSRSRSSSRVPIDRPRRSATTGSAPAAPMTGTGRVVVLGVGPSPSRSGRSVLLALGLRTTFGLPWRGVVGALALATVIVAASPSCPRGSEAHAVRLTASSALMSILLARSLV